MKKIVLSLLVALSCMTVKAADGKSLFVTFNDGQKVEFALTTTPHVTFGNDQMTIQTTETTASYDLWKVTTFTYGDTAAGISQAETSHQIALEGNRIIIDGTTNKVSAFALDGRAVTLSPTIIGNKTIINLDGLIRGAYIIKLNNKSIKIARQ